MNKRQEIIESIAAVPPLPTASVEVIRMIQDPKVPSGRIAQAIEYDPSLTTNVLRLANSSFFGFHRSVSTVKDALFRLGTNQVFQLVVAATVGKMAQTPLNGYDLSSGDLWDHLVGTAIASVKLAQTLKIQIPSYTFTAALTHDVGKVVLGTFLEVNAESVNLPTKKKCPLSRRNGRCSKSITRRWAPFSSSVGTCRKISWTSSVGTIRRRNIAGRTLAPQTWFT